MSLMLRRMLLTSSLFLVGPLRHGRARRSACRSERCDLWPRVELGTPAAATPGLPGSGVSMTRSEPSHLQHSASNYCTALPVCSPGPGLAAQCQGVNTALLTLHTVCARG